MLIYLASPYSHDDPAVRVLRYEDACVACAALMRAGVTVISPIASSHAIAELGGIAGSWEQWRDLDLRLLDACDAVWVLTLDGWEKSAGVAAEIDYAEAHGKPVRGLQFPVSNIEIADLIAMTQVALNANVPAPKAAPPATGGRKDDTGKARFDLIPVRPLRALADVYTIGARKYSDRNWERGIAWGRVFAALCRHAFAWWGGEQTDPVDGQHHLASVAWCALALIEYETTHPELDDRAPRG